ncbi:hypothetical protein TNCV_2121291 [Trichonephila clavipes]|nr:hypothetical protein TNCV_2121291 [Trichonephila clavipes]
MLETVHPGTAKSMTGRDSVANRIHYWLKCFRVYSSVSPVFIWDCGAAVSLICLCSPSIIANYDYSGPENIENGPKISERALPDCMNHDFSFDHVNGRVKVGRIPG